MYLIAGIIIFIYIFLFLISRKIESEIVRNGVLGIFDKMALFILSRIPEKIKFGKNQQTDIYLSQLYPGEDRRECRTKFVIKKLSLSLMTVFIGTVFALLIKLQGSGKAFLDSNGMIERSNYDGEAISISVTANVEDYEGVIEFEVKPRLLETEELDSLLPEFYEKLENILLAENSSLVEITSDLNLVNKISGYPFSISWTSSDFGLVSPSNGAVSEVEEECQVFLTATIKYEDTRWDREYLLTLIPPELSGEEEVLSGIKNMVARAEERSRQSYEFYLPEEYEGSSIHWSEINRDISIYIFCALLFISIILYFVSDRDLEKKVNEKKHEMQKKYGEIVKEIALYVGAGMTIRSAFNKVALDGVNSSDKNPIYNEMIFTSRELKSGVTEEEAYERFGRRTGVQEYIRLGTLLQQNIKRGNASLVSRLSEEAENASSTRIRECRKKGEEASTKLLVPMVLLLLVVMVIIMLPAFSSVNL